MNTNDQIEQYKRYRNIAKEYLSHLVTEIDDTRRNYKRIGKLLGVFRENAFIFEDENESFAFIDFALCEKLYGGRSRVDQELDSQAELTQEMIEILEAFKDSYTSLFEIVDKNPEKSTIQLRDLLNGGETEILDIHFSKLAPVGGLLFCRVVFLQGFNMNSGVAFGFRGQDKELILRRYRALSKSKFTIDKSITRFIAFFNLNRQFGIPVKML